MAIVQHPVVLSSLRLIPALADQLRFSQRSESKTYICVHVRAPLACLMRVVRFRVECHSLPCVVGRFDNIPRHRRLGPRCSHTCASGDELHLFCENPSIQPLRQIHRRLFSGPTSKRHFLWQAYLWLGRPVCLRHSGRHAFVKSDYAGVTAGLALLALRIAPA